MNTYTLDDAITCAVVESIQDRDYQFLWCTLPNRLHDVFRAHETGNIEERDRMITLITYNFNRLKRVDDPTYVLPENLVSDFKAAITKFVV